MNHVLNIAHRGFSSRFPENTMLAFEKAIEAEVDGFECDLRLTADGEVVLFHDDDLKRLCSTTGSIERMTWKDVSALRVLGREKIPHLQDVLETYQPKVINLEIKPSSREAVVVESVFRLLSKVNTTSRLLISSFSLEVLRSVDTMDPNRHAAELGILLETKSISQYPELSKTLRAQTWNVPRQILSSPWHRRWEGVDVKPLWIWTLDEPHDWRAALTSPLPVEAVITNKPDAFGQFLSSFTASR